MDRLLSSPGPGGIVESDGKQCRLLGKAEKGGVRIEGIGGDPASRTVSLTDIAWVLAADDDVANKGGILDE